MGYDSLVPRPSGEELARENPRDNTEDGGTMLIGQFKTY